MLCNQAAKGHNAVYKLQSMDLLLPRDVYAFGINTADIPIRCFFLKIVLSERIRYVATEFLELIDEIQLLRAKLIIDGRSND